MYIHIYEYMYIHICIDIYINVIYSLIPGYYTAEHADVHCGTWQ